MRAVLRWMRDTVALWVLLVSLIGMPAPAVAQAQPTTYLWGIARNGCRMDETLGRAVETRLLQMGESVRRLQLNPDTDIGSCTDKECAGRFLQVCPGTAGTLLGGYLEEKKIKRDGPDTSEAPAAEDVWLRVRLWKVDLATQQTTQRTHTCRGCSATDLITRHAADLIEQAAPDAQELSCSRASLDYLTEKEANPEPERLVLLVSSAVKERRGVRRALQDTLKRHIRLTHREVTIEENKHGQPLPQLRKRHAGEHLLEVVLRTDGEAQVQYLEQSAADPVSEKVECFGCSEADLVHRVTLSVSSLLDRCYSESCRRGPQSVALHRPTLVCAPLVPPTECGFGGAAAAVSVDPTLPPPPPPPDFLKPPCARAASGAESRAAVVLQSGGNPALTQARPEALRRRLSAAGTTLLSLGVTGLATMAVVLASNGRSGLGQCRDPQGRSPDAQCRIAIPQAAKIAVAAGVTGGGLMLAGAVLLGAARHKAKPSTR